MGLVLIAQALQNLHGCLCGRLAHRHRLETALQRGVLFDVFAVFIQRGGADHADFAAAQGRLDDIGGIHRALCAACTHDGVQLVDEQDHIAGLLDLRQRVFDALFKFTAVLGACHHARKVKGQDFLVQQLLRHIG